MDELFIFFHQACSVREKKVFVIVEFNRPFNLKGLAHAAKANHVKDIFSLNLPRECMNAMKQPQMSACSCRFCVIAYSYIEKLNSEVAMHML